MVSGGESEQMDSGNPPQVATIEPYNLINTEPAETEYITVPDEVQFTFLFKLFFFKN